MSKYEAPAAAAVLGFAGFQLLQAYQNSAPPLSDIRKTQPSPGSDTYIHYAQRLMDADFLVGGLAVILGVTFAILAKDLTALVVMLVIFGSVSMWYHNVLKAEAR